MTSPAKPNQTALFPRIKLQSAKLDDLSSTACSCLLAPKRLLDAFVQISSHLECLNSLYNDNLETDSKLLDVDVECDCMVELVQWIISKLTQNILSKNNNETTENKKLLDYVGSLEKHLTSLESNFLFLENGALCKKCLAKDEAATPNLGQNDKESNKTPELLGGNPNNSLCTSVSQNESISFDKIIENNKGKTSFDDSTETEVNKNYASLRSQSNSSMSSISSIENKQESYMIKNNKLSFAIDTTMQFESLNITDPSRIEEILFNNKTNDIKVLNLKIKQKDIAIKEYKNELKIKQETIEKMKKTREEWYEKRTKEVREKYIQKTEEYQKKESHIIKSQTNEIEYMKAKLEMYRIKVKQLSDAVSHFTPISTMQLADKVDQSYYDSQRPSIFSSNIQKKSTNNLAVPSKPSPSYARPLSASKKPSINKHRYSQSSISSGLPKNAISSENNTLTRAKPQFITNDKLKNKKSAILTSTKKPTQTSIAGGNGFGYLTKRPPIKYSTNS